jgi:hypothetical protein
MGDYVTWFVSAESGGGGDVVEGSGFDCEFCLNKKTGLPFVTPVVDFDVELCRQRPFQTLDPGLTN